MSSGRLIFPIVAALCVLGQLVSGHETSLPHFLKQRRTNRTKAERQSEAVGKQESGLPTCRLNLQLRDAVSGRPLYGLVRIKNQISGKFLRLRAVTQRDAGWYVLPPKTPLEVPCTQLAIEALHGLETETTSLAVDTRNRKQFAAEIRLRRFYDAHQQGWRSGNTHLHLQRLSMQAAIRYLQEVPRADGLDVVFVSYLRRVPDEGNYISNQLTAADLSRLSQQGTLFGNGQEHRHNFQGFGQGYGHVMMLDLTKLIRPVSIGPGIMRSGTDGRPLQTGIREARADGSTIIWCHNALGLEDLPNWLAGLIHAQNIFDGGNQGSYHDSYYRYLNLGMKIPFSTGTDWFIYDFSRVYVPLQNLTDVKQWLNQLKQGRGYITNGPLLDFQVDSQPIGAEIMLPQARQVTISGKATGRADFHTLELVHNGKVVAQADARPRAGHYHAQLPLKYNIANSGWLAMRVSVASPKQNAFGKAIFAHTSPIYVRVAGERQFDRQIAESMIAEMQASRQTVLEQGTFADQKERDSVLRVYDDGIRMLLKQCEVTQVK